MKVSAIPVLTQVKGADGELVATILKIKTRSGTSFVTNGYEVDGSFIHPATFSTEFFICDSAILTAYEFAKNQANKAFTNQLDQAA